MTTYKIYPVNFIDYLVGGKHAKRLFYLQSCLKEYSDANKQGAYKTRRDYLKARKEEIALHRENWKREDEQKIS